MSQTGTLTGLAEHAPQTALNDPGEIARLHDRCSDLAEAPDQPRDAAPSPTGSV